MVASVASSRSAASVVPSQAKSRAAAAERRYRPRLVGEVRWASAGAGSSWKLSGGSMWSAAVTKVSKNRQVRRAISRRAWASAADTDIRPAIPGRPAGPARDRRRGDPQGSERHRQGPRAMPRQQGDQHRQNTEDDPAGHHAIEAEEVEPGTDRRLGRRNPFEEMPAGDEQPHQGPRDRIAHQPRLMRQEGDDERRLGKREAQIGAERVEMAAQRDPGAARHDGADDGDEGGQQDRQQDEAGPHRRGSERQRPSRQQGQHASRRRQRSPQIVEHLPAADRRDGAARPIRAGDRPATEYPRQQLPVAARPAVVAHRVDVVTGGEFLDDLDIGGETGAGEDCPRTDRG